MKAVWSPAAASQTFQTQWKSSLLNLHVEHMEVFLLEQRQIKTGAD